MKANPGGQVAVEHIVGRDALISNLWEILEEQSVLLTAERRIGKTSIIRRMRAQPPAGWVPIFRDLERFHSTTEFARFIYQDVVALLSEVKRIAKRARDFLDSIGGTEIAGVLKLPEGEPTHWKTLVIRAIEDLTEHRRDARVVFFWDEMPYMLDNIRRREGEDTAIELLDVLRSLRQSHPSFRMVLTGSIGLHHVLTSLETSIASLNDMYPVEVPPLGETDATALARELIVGEGLTSSDPAAAASAVAEAGDGVPFYIHHIVRYLRLNGRPAEVAEVSQAMEAQLLDANDPWELDHYRERLRSYYGADEPIATAVLDTLATAERPQSVDELLKYAKSQGSFDDRERLHHVLKLMQRDHYVARSSDGHYRFRFELIRRWWALDRVL